MDDINEQDIALTGEEFDVSSAEDTVESLEQAIAEEQDGANNALTMEQLQKELAKAKRQVATHKGFTKKASEETAELRAQMAAMNAQIQSFAQKQATELQQQAAEADRTEDESFVQKYIDRGFTRDEIAELLTEKREVRAERRKIQASQQALEKARPALEKLYIEQRIRDYSKTIVADLIAEYKEAGFKLELTPQELMDSFDKQPQSEPEIDKAARKLALARTIGQQPNARQRRQAKAEDRGDADTFDDSAAGSLSFAEIETRYNAGLETHANYRKARQAEVKAGRMPW